MVNKKIEIIKQILVLCIITLFSCISVVFSCLYFDLFNEGFIYNNQKILKIITYILITTIAIATIILYKINKQIIYKLFLIGIIAVSMIFVLLYLYIVTGLSKHFNSVESFRNYISTFGSKAWLIFTVISFLQVVVLPIPAFIDVGAGTLLFGPLWGGIYCFIGIFTGSIVAYFIGRIFGIKVASWLVGKKNLDRGLKLIEGKDKVILTFMFLFPFFPDDVLCFVSGITTIGPLFFVVMIFITRVISIFISTYSMNNSLIPYDTWWGILIWVIIAILVVIISYFMIKYGNRIESYMKKKFSRKK